ncbi:MAG: hypothetical protein HY814_04910 [Candidatus Riflebacteria bacterium]|nr:hypothetical protein [Candidatus Riflebacteria bacterium]
MAALLVAGLAGLLPAQEGGGGGGQSTMVLDAANNSLIIRTTPRNHRRIATLITKLAKARLEGEKQETRMFNVRNLSPEQFFKILEFQRPTFQRTSTLVVPETANGQNLTGGR